MVGAGFINSLNAGALDLAALPGSIAGQIPAASAGMGSAPLLGGTGGEQASGAANNFRIFVHVDDAIGRAWLDKGGGKKILYRHILNDRSELGMEG